MSITENIQLLYYINYRKYTTTLLHQLQKIYNYFITSITENIELLYYINYRKYTTTLLHQLQKI